MAAESASARRSQVVRGADDDGLDHAMRAIRKAEVGLTEGKFLSAEELRAKYLKR